MSGFDVAVAEPKPLLGAHTPLFYRLCDNEMDNVTDLGNYTFIGEKDYINSIINEITILLNTRCAAKRNTYERLISTSINNLGLPHMYGIPDFNDIDPANSSTWWNLSQLFIRAIGYFEPRLHDVDVKINTFQPRHQRLYITVYGRIILQSYQAEVSFPALIGREEDEDEMLARKGSTHKMYS